MKTNHSSWIGASVVSCGVLVAIGFSGCDAKQSSAPKREIQAVTELQQFPAANMEFLDNSFFLWKEGTVQEGGKYAQRVISSSWRMDEIRDRVVRMNEIRTDIKARFAKTEVNFDQIRVQLTNAQDQIAFQKNDLKQMEEDLAKEMARPESERDPSYIEEIQGYIAEAKEIISEKESLIHDLVRQMEDAGMGAEWKQWASIDIEHASLTDEYLSKARQVEELTDFYNVRPSRILFNLADPASPSVSIEGWNPEDGSGQRTMPGELDRISDISYDSQGGTIEFDLTTPVYLFHFKISRTRYGALDGLVYMNGDITRTEIRTGAIRRGSVKLVSQKF